MKIRGGRVFGGNDVLRQDRSVFQRNVDTFHFDAGGGKGIAGIVLLLDGRLEDGFRKAGFDVGENDG